MAILAICNFPESARVLKAGTFFVRKCQLVFREYTLRLVYTYLRSGDFDAALQVADPGACTNAKSKTITIRLLRGDGEQTVALPYVEVVRSQVYPQPVSRRRQREPDVEPRK